ncbi:3,9-dihydroxypterocarpan 6A-monooxygenase [Cucumis melo var. makuwa]|uniref:3,9-dihydroxypterocarpan 6A-monooxygenase n=2 Tax=Cucumis melo TaxID=3656 RepID=A0A5A7TKA5_CUCMM|nr:3,9-dihydroxypterocarpan 6A-monooxygenase [Cucumis melo var. makuwa]TYK25422.1 3,9-dihydroxypterocarpan 6A-monooxygenase [Cucumis melo var. makuwa]
MADFSDYFLLLSLLLTSFLFVRVLFTRTHPDKLRRPPSPLSLPVIGHLHLLGQIPHQALYKLSCQYGPLIHLFFGSKPCVIVSDSEMAKQFLKTNESSFLNRPIRLNINYLTYGSKDFTFAPYGPYWKFLKKLCMTELLSSRTLDLFHPIRDEEMRLFVQRIHEQAIVGGTVDVGAELSRLMNNIISRMVLRKRCTEKDNGSEEVGKLVGEMCELAGALNVADMIWFCKRLDLQGFGRRVRNVRKRYDIMMEKIINEHEEERKRKKEDGEDDGVKDLLDILLDIYEDQSSEIKLTRDNIKAFVMNIFGAGTETSAAATEWALAELINNPSAMAKATQELHSVTGNNTRLLLESDLSKLPYLQAVVKETLRLHPTAPLIVREATEPCDVAGYHIPAKTRLLVNIWGIARDPSRWLEPTQFDPERFLNRPSGSDQQSFDLMPFGSGRRSCPGAALALVAMPMVLGRLIQCFEWRVDGGGSVDMEEGPGISLRRARPLILIPVPKLHLFPSI